MKKTGLAFLLSLLVVGFLGSFKPVEKHELQVHVYDLQNSRGNVVVMLYNKDGSIPDKNFTNYYKKIVVEIKNKEAIAVFNSIPIGKYAINVFHDENKNDKLDKGLFLPKEGFGLSNFKKVNLLNRPNFQKASFVFDKDTEIKIKTIYL